VEAAFDALARVRQLALVGLNALLNGDFQRASSLLHEIQGAASSEKECRDWIASAP
jgi:hypothetical protein